MRRTSLLLILGALLLVLIALAIWAGVRRNSVGGVALVYPISRTSEIDVNLWPVAPGLRVTIWHQDTEAATSTRLAAFTLPAWLLVVLGGGVGGMLIAGLVLVYHHLWTARR